MIKTINQDIFKATKQAILHQANCFGVMGGGFAKILREVYPEAAQVDSETQKGCKEKLGSFSCVKAKDGIYIYNMYSQYRYGAAKRHTDYESFYTGLKAVEAHAKMLGLHTIAIPYGIGCGLGGGSWKIIYAIIEEIFESSTIELVICKI
jgi:O-acetyl-ADP-ribose deacetylase (regulator of RNase III)